MASDGQSVDRLREYLRTLKPEARSMLVVELERGLLRGEETAGNDLVLQELRHAIRAEAQKMPRIGDAARLFFVPLEPFLVDGVADHKRPGRFARGSLEPIWTWLSRDLLPAEVKALSEDINRALAAKDRPKADQLVRALHERAIARMREALAAVGSDEKAQRKLAAQVGTSRALEDVATLLGILQIRDLLADMEERLPSHIRTFERNQIDAIKAQFDFAFAVKPRDCGPTWQSDVLIFGLVMVMNRMSLPWQLVRIAVRAADSDDPARIAETPYAVAVSAALGELEGMVSELRADLKAGRPVTSLLKELHDAARGLRTELDLSVDSAWSGHLAAIRGDVSNLLKSEIELTPGRVRQLLRSRPVKDIAPGSLLDALAVEEAHARIELLVACRNYAAELALSEVTTRVYADLTQYLETVTKMLVEALRQADGGERPFKQAQVDAAIRFCGTVFGGDYAALLARTAEMALRAPVTERIAIRA
jgi:hypothetical protein